MLLLPLLFCCALQRSCGAAGDTNPRGRPEDRTWLLACGPCWLCLMSLGPFGIAIKALRGGRNGLLWLPSAGPKARTLRQGGVGREGKDGGGGGSGGGFHQLSALLECSAALLARLRAQPALLEGFVTLLALPA